MITMRLPSRHYNLFYAINFLLIGFAISLFFFSYSHNTFADEDPTQSISDTHFVTIHDQDQSLTIKTDARTVAEALERANLTFNESDRIEPSSTDPINADNFHINIYRAHPVIITDGIIKKYLMSATYDPKTIATEAGISVYDGDEVELVPNYNLLETGIAPIYQIKHNGGQTITTEQSIPFTEETIADSTLDSGQNRIEQVGEDGLKVLKYQVNFVDGVEVSRELVSETVTKEPVKRITAVGSKQASTATVNTAIPPERETCASWAREAGVSEADLAIALEIIYRESGCRVDATNAYSGAYGIPQALPGTKMASAGADWQTNPVTQIRWMSSYVSRYGGWAGAWAWWEAHHWY